MVTGAGCRLAQAHVCRRYEPSGVTRDHLSQPVHPGVEAQTKATGSRQFEAFFRRAGIIIEPVTEEQAHIARQAYTDFGKGRHKAGLNFGDCFAYALAKTAGETLLFKGEDFKKTDVASAI